MAWMEQRRRRFVVYTRMDGAKAKGPSYAARADAELFVTLAERFGWHAAQEFVTDDKPATAAGPAERTIREQAVAGGAIEDPAALPASDAGLLAPHGREPSGVSVGELTRRHFDAGTARAKTLEQYRSKVRDHVDPFFGDLDAAYVIRQSHPLAEGTSAKDVVTWRAWLAAQPVLTRHGRPTGRTLAAKTIKNVMSLVASAYDTAMHDEFSPLVGFNPVTGLAPTQTAADEIERVFLSPRQFGDLYWHTIDHYRHLLLFLVLTGLRWGEAAGLRVRDVTLHPEKGRPYLEVRTALKRVKSGTLLGLLKSRAARRRLTIPTLLVPTIEDAIAGKDLDDILQEGHGHGEGNEQRHCSGSNRIHIGWRLVISPAFGPKSRDEDEGSGTDQQYTQQDVDGDASSHLRMLLVRAGTSTGSRTTAKSCPSTDPATACATG